MTNEDVLNDMLRKTFPNVIFIRSVNEHNNTQGIHFSEEWLKHEYSNVRTYLERPYSTDRKRG